MTRPMGTCFQRKMFAKLSVLVLVALALSLGTCHANDADFEAFMKWFAQRGGEASQLRLANFEGMGTGLLAVKQVRESDAVIKVPLSLVAYGLAATLFVVLVRGITAAISTGVARLF